jgi:hypothetical protein
MQLVVEAQRSADAGLAGRMPAMLPAATMLANPSRNRRLKLMFIKSSPPVSWRSVKPFVRMWSAMKRPDVIIH